MAGKENYTDSPKEVVGPSSSEEEHGRANGQGPNMRRRAGCNVHEVCCPSNMDLHHGMVEQ